MNDKTNPEILTGINFASAAHPSIVKLENNVKNLEAKLEETRSNFEKSRYDIITLIGLFVGLITYLGLEIQVFKAIDNPLLIIGISIFFIASILLFILTMNIILKKSGEESIKDFTSPLYIILCILLLISLMFIVYGNKIKVENVNQHSFYYYFDNKNQRFVGSYQLPN